MPLQTCHGAGGSLGPKAPRRRRHRATGTAALPGLILLALWWPPGRDTPNSPRTAPAVTPAKVCRTLLFSFMENFEGKQRPGAGFVPNPREWHLWGWTEPKGLIRGSLNDR